MDPGANLREQYELALRILNIVGGHEGIGELEDDATRLAELVVAHQEWREKAGFASQHPASMPSGKPVNPSERLASVFGDSAQSSTPEPTT